MSNWNYNGLNILEPHVRKSKSSKKMVELKEIREVDKELEKKDEKYEKKLETITKLVKQRAGSLDTNIYKHILEEYISLRLSKYKKSSDYYPYYRVIVDNNFNSGRHYLSCNVTILYFRAKEDLDRDNYACIVSFSLKELFGNCSSIVIDKLSGVLCSEHAELCMNICEEICYISGYSTILYTCSKTETSGNVEVYLKDSKDWKNIKEFINKRNGHTIIYYTKDL